MSRNISDTRSRTSIAPSYALLSAALGGLLCLGTACGSSNKTHSSSTGGSGGASSGGAGGSATGGTGGSATGGAGGASSGGTGGSATGGTGGSATGGTGGTPTDGGPDGSTDAATDATSDASDAATYVYCSNAPDAGTVISSMTVAMTQAEFQAMCASNGGTFEIMPHCGGFNSCMGISYDAGSQVLSDHTCRGLNTCAGYSCVICN